MKVTPYLNFDGTCAEAFRFYEQVLGGKIEDMMTYNDMPEMAEHMPPDKRGQIMHACLDLGGQKLMASDSPPGQHQAAQGLWVSLHFDRASEGKRVFDALTEGGQVQMPFEKTPWASGFGMAVDRFGTPWMINCEQEG